jgi:hypothetical protein
MIMETIKEEDEQLEQNLIEPKKSKRKIYAIIAIVVGVLIYFLVPNDSTTDNSEASDLASTEATISVGKVQIVSFEAKKRLLGKWVITGVISNASDAPIESIEFETVFSDNAEFVNYYGFIKAGESRHEFTIKVTGHKGENLNELKIREVQKAK